ncbi:lactate racemase domain-containing protein [Anaerosinus massiliensis]|uniref:nickel-dependent lactate racemase n=1 Tax=Massilibacillus massiliensis TaxID=1806837 RepID=UPI000B3128F8|nr:nickel-dependent lactate racemase [Massilibacillus massiliensis]
MLQDYVLRYGAGEMVLRIEKEKVLQVIESNPVTFEKTEEEILADALAQPIGSARLSELVHRGEKVCIVIPDVTRAWQKTSFYLPKLIEELEQGGIQDEDIVFICALGTHRGQTAEEHRMLLGPALADRFTVVDHDCYDKDKLKYLGKTTYGTPVWINKTAMDCDHIVLAGGIVYHFLAGWAGGRKYILPGISSYETVMANHSLSLNPERGKGPQPDVRSGNIENNLLHLDMLEAASFVRPTFMFNVIIAENRIAGAVAGNYIAAHEAGRNMVDAIDGVSIEERADLVVASAGGSPKDVNLYQSIKTLINAREAANPGGTIIMLTECPEGLGGNADVQDMILNYDTVLEREDALRADYSISKYVAYYFCETAEKYNLILVSSLEENLLAKAKIQIVKTLDAAMQLAHSKGQVYHTVHVMPHAANTLPRVK